MINVFKKNKPLFLLFFVVLVFGILTLVNLQLAQTEQQGSDFYTNWLATRNFITQGISPYFSQDSNSSSQSFSLPLFSIFLYLPLALIKNYFVASAMWMTLLEIGIIAILFLSIKVAYWKTTPIIFTSLILFSFFGFQGLLPLLNGNLIIFTALMITGIVITIRNKQDEAAGMLLALLWINPIPAILFIIFIFVWLIANRRIKVIQWFLGTMVLLIGFSFVLIPSWVIQFLHNLIIDYQLIDPGSPGSVLAARWGEIGTRISIIISVLIGILLLIEWVQVRRTGSRKFVWAAMLTLGLSTWSGIKISPVNYVMILPALILGLNLLCERWKQRAHGIVISILALLFIGNWAIYFLTMSSDFKAAISSFLIIPLPLMVIFLLYWSKWWIERASRIELEKPFIEVQKL